jgi:RNA polymerase sigma factor (sigma-70 family)
VDVSAGTSGSLPQFLQEHSPFFLNVIRSYVVRMGLARGDAVQSVAMAVLHEAVIETFAHADRFANASQPRAWFLAVAANVLKRKRREMARQSHYESPMSELIAHPEDTAESAFFEQIVYLAVPGPEQEVETSERFREMLSLVSEEDQRILRLAILHDLNGQMLADALAISPGAARSRLHRALARLRLAWVQYEQQEMERYHV